jgi:hypothetical protein
MSAIPLDAFLERVHFLLQFARFILALALIADDVIRQTRKCE